MFKFIPFILLTVLYSPLFWRLYTSVWETIDYTHAYFILPISLWLVWRKRQGLVHSQRSTVHGHRGQGQRSTVHGLNRRQWTLGYGQVSISTLLFGIFLFIVGNRFDYTVVQTFSLIPVLFGLVGYLYGPKMIRILLFPILYLLLLVPPPLGILDSITLPMRYGVSRAADIFLRSFFIPVQREGLLLYVGGEEIYMGQPCSGLRSLVTMFSLALVYVYVSRISLRNKIILLLSVVPLALIGNFIRVVLLCMVTYFLGSEVGQGFYHNFSGIVIFVFMIFGLMALEAWLKGKDEE